MGGIWNTPLHQRPDRHLLLAEIFAPVPFTPDVGDWAVIEAGFVPGTHWEHRSWELEWKAEDCFDRLTVCLRWPHNLFTICFRCMLRSL
jgi:hypothetical protein